MRDAVPGLDRPRTLDVTRDWLALLNGIERINPETVILLSDEARAVYSQTDRDCLTLGQRNDPFGTFCGKQPRTLLTLTFILQLCEIAEGRAGPTDLVPIETIERAARILWDFIIPHAEAFYDSDPTRADENRHIATAILKHNDPVIKIRDLRHATRSLRTLTDNDFRKKIYPFVANEWLTPISRLPDNNAWTITDGLRQHFAEPFRAQLDLEKHIKDRIRANMRNQKT